MVVKVRVVEHGLGRYAADVQTGATERAPFFYACGSQAQLRSLNGRDVPAGA